MGPKEVVDNIFDGTDLSRSQLAANTLSYNTLKSSGIVYNTTLFPERQECQKMTADWSYQSQFRSYNPEGGKGTGEIIWMDGFYGQSVYVDRKADLVIVQLATDAN